MSNTHIGLLAGLLITLAIAVSGFFGFLLALVFGTIGTFVGAQLDGRVDVNEILRGRRG